MIERKRKTTAVLSLGYWFGAHSLGLLVHPYVSMRRIVREKGFVPLVLLPSVCLVVWWVVGVVVAHVDVLVKIGLGVVAFELEKFGPIQIVLSFGFVWGGVFFGCWQVLLLYLWQRFRVLGRSRG